MTSYRPNDRGRDHRREYDQDGREDLGFQIRGRASMNERRGRERAYRDLDGVPRDSDRYHDSSAYSRRSHYDNSSSDYYPRPQSDSYDMYDEPEQPADNNGDTDVAHEDGPVLPFLLIRGLKANVDETLLSKGLDKLYLDAADRQPDRATVMPALPGAPNRSANPSQSGAAPKSLKRVFIIRDRVTNKSLQYGFAEYHSKTDAQAALAKAEELGDRCTVSSKHITVCFPHTGVFPLSEPRDDARFTFQMTSGNHHKYHDQRYWASNFVVNEDSPVRPRSPSPPKQAAPKTSKKRTNPATTDTLDNPGKKSKPEGPSSTMMQKWQKKQAELRGEEDDSDHSSSGPAVGTTQGSEAVEDLKHAQSFIWKGEKKGKHGTFCLLCNTIINTTKVIPRQHVEGSAKHAALLRDEATYKKGFERLKDWGVAEDATLQISITQPKPAAPIRDRAKERREQEAKAGSTEKISLSLKPPKSKPAPTPSAPAPPSYGKGMDMLQKAGWKEGQSLGDGSGRTAIIEQNVFAAGVGLGHEGGKKGDAVEEAERLTKGDGKSFLDRTKEAARERFEKMG